MSRELDAEVAEKWLPVPDYPEYEISDCGRVRSVQKDKILALYFNKKGYALVQLWRSGRCVAINVHRLMALAFLGPPPSPKHQAAHDDGDSRHNVIGNIKWKTAKENIADKERHGTKALGERTNSVKLTTATVQQIRQRYSEGVPGYVLAKEYDVHRSTAYRIINMEHWQHV